MLWSCATWFFGKESFLHALNLCEMLQLTLNHSNRFEYIQKGGETIPGYRSGICPLAAIPQNPLPTWRFPHSMPSYSLTIVQPQTKQLVAFHEILVGLDLWMLLSWLIDAMNIDMGSVIRNYYVCCIYFYIHPVFKCTYMHIHLPLYNPQPTNPKFPFFIAGRSPRCCISLWKKRFSVFRPLAKLKHLLQARVTHV